MLMLIHIIAGYIYDMFLFMGRWVYEFYKKQTVLAIAKFSARRKKNNSFSLCRDIFMFFSPLLFEAMNFRMFSLS